MKVDKFIFPADFVVLDMEEDEDIPIILGRPFLNTAGALIDVRQRELTLRMSDESILFKMLSPSKNSALAACKCVKALNLEETSSAKHNEEGSFKLRDSESLRTRQARDVKQALSGGNLSVAT